MEKRVSVDKILVAEDERVTRLSLCRVLESEGFFVIEASNGKEALEHFKKDAPSAAIVDLNMPVMDGRDAIAAFREIDPSVPVVVVTGSGDVSTAVETMKLGAYDFLAKPVAPGKLIITVKRAVEKFKLERELKRLYNTEEASLERLLGKGPTMKKVIDQIKQVSTTDFSVILQGETGTGKTFVAKIMHDISKRAGKGFIRVDLASIPETLVESEIFGYEAGAFTGATQPKTGYFEAANGGTILIDDLENLSPAVQSKLLTVFDTKRIARLGSKKNIDLDVRIIGATNKYIQDCVNKGEFREDLFFRLGEFIITLPPLRSRKEDIPFLASKFLEDAAIELEKRVGGLSPDVTSRIAEYHWPGNIRQLKNVMRRAALLSEDGEIKEEHLDFLIKRTRDEGEELPLTPLKDAVGKTESRLIKETLAATKGNRSKAASILKIDIKTLRTKMAEYGIK